MVKLYDIGRLRFYAGLMIVTAAVMMLQIIETRIISVISWYYLAFFVISVAMFGLTAGAVWVYLHPKVFTPSSNLNVSDWLVRSSETWIESPREPSR